MTKLSIISVSIAILLLCSPVVSASIYDGHSAGMSFQVEKIGDIKGIPWAIERLDEKHLLITERSGSLYRLNRFNGNVRKIDIPIDLYARGQGGLLDVRINPSQTTAADLNPWIYFTYSKPVKLGGNHLRGQTALARAKLVSGALVDWQDLFISNSSGSDGRHFGSRVVFDNQGYLYMSIGDHGERENGQRLDTHAGSIIRLNSNGSVPPHNPFIKKAQALDEIWSYGHRNPQGLFFDQKNQRLWAIEHGPRGGDEINLIKKGLNYGWPLISHGKEYWGPFQVGEGTHAEGIEPSIKEFTPSIAPCDMIIYQGKAFPKWQGNIISASLKLRHLNRITLDPKQLKPLSEERLLGSMQRRIRALHESSEGWIYLSTDQGEILKLSPKH